MNLYIISYDLRQPGRDYRSLYDAIRSFGRTIRPLESVWFIGSNLPAANVRDMLQKHIDRNDRLLVMQTGKTAAWCGIDNSDGATLKASIEAQA